MNKKLSVPSLVLLLAFVSSLCARAIEIDAIAGRNEWENSSVYNLNEQHDFLNDVKTAIVNVYYDDYESCLYLLARCEMKKLYDTDAATISFSVNGSEQTEISFSGEVLSSPYETQTATQVNEEDRMAFIETVCPIKDGLALPAEIKFAVTDSAGVSSNIYTLDYTKEQAEESGNSETESRSRTEKTKAEKSKKSAGKKSAAGKTAKAKSTTTDFTFSKATKSAPGTNASKSGAVNVEETTSAKIEISSSTENERRLIIIIGTVCAMALIFAGTYAAVKKNKINQEDDTKQK